MKILVAPQAFKGSISAKRVAEIIKQAVEVSISDCEVKTFPFADGGDGTRDALYEILGGSFQKVALDDPYGRAIQAYWGLSKCKTVSYLESAELIGWSLCKDHDADILIASTKGIGEWLMATQLEGSEWLIGLGGSATNDAGIGMLQAVGTVFLDSNGKKIQGSLENFRNISSIDFSKVPLFIREKKKQVLLDVWNRLVGTKGATFVYGPQKGATEKELALLEEILQRFQDVVFQQEGVDFAQLPGSGAAGGLAAGLYLLGNCSFASGAQYFMNHLDEIAGLQDLDLLIVGEGCLDASSFYGKGPVQIATKAREKGIKTLAFVGSIGADLVACECIDPFDELVVVGDQPLKKNLNPKKCEEELFDSVIKFFQKIR